jgi:hypothetical protein
MVVYLELPLDCYVFNLDMAWFVCLSFLQNQSLPFQTKNVVVLL